MLRLLVPAVNVRLQNLLCHCSQPLGWLFYFPEIKGNKNIVNRTVFHCDMLFHQRKNVPGECVNFDEIFIGKGLKQITSAVLFYFGSVKTFCFAKVKTRHFDCPILIN